MLARDPGDAVALNNSALCRMYACGLGDAIKVCRALAASLSSWCPCMDHKQLSGEQPPYIANPRPKDARAGLE